MKEVFYSMSDIELGDGSEIDDFWNDELFAEKLRQLDKKHGATPVYLVLNGDVFDFIRVPYMKSYPRYITKDVALWKMRAIHHAHKVWFKAVKDFARKKKNKVIFIYGNHDMDVAFFEVQELLRKLIHPNIVFSGFEFERGVVRFEHGSQHELIFYINPDRIFLPVRGTKVLNLPWITYALLEFHSRLKALYPYVDRVHPKEDLPTLYPKFHRGVTWQTFKYMVRAAIVNQIRYFNDMTYRISLRMIGHFVLRLITGNYDVVFEDNLKAAAKKRADLQAVVAGHSHFEKLEKIRSDCFYVNTGAWRDEYIVSRDRSIKPKNKAIAELVVENNQIKQVFLHRISWKPKNARSVKRALRSIDESHLKELSN